MQRQPAETEIVEVQACEIRPLRHAVLRPGQPAVRLVYPGDDEAGTIHLAIRDSHLNDHPIVSVASFYLEAVPENVEHKLCGVSPGSLGVRIRGMATLEEYRGLGFGRRLVDHGVELLLQRHAKYDSLWCNARTSAAGYYEKLGFAAGSALFDIPDIGEHVVMVRAQPQAR